jgi:hypothetical protein
VLQHFPTVIYIDNIYTIKALTNMNKKGTHKNRPGQNDIVAIFVYIEYVYDNCIQDIEVLVIVVCDICYNKLT